MLLSGLLFASVVACGQAWILEATETRVIKKLSTNITISCSYDGKDNNLKPLGVISRIRLQKFEKGSQWNTIAKNYVSNQVATTTFADAQTSGFAGKPNDTFLTLHFDIASENSIGLFQCEVDGFDTDDEMEMVKSNQVNIYERGVSLDDLLNIILGLKATEHTDNNTDNFRLGLLEKAVRLLESQGNSRASAIAGVQETINTEVNNLKKNNDNLKKNINSDLKKTNGDLKKTNDDLKKTNEDLIKVQGQLHAQLYIIKKVIGYNHPWPEGTYALLNTSSGCPDFGTSGWVWEESYVQITTQKGATNQDNTSTPIHLSENPIEELQGKNVFTSRFCSKSTSSAGPAWPKGSYCFNSFIWKDCPANFGFGFIRIGRAYSPVIDKYNNLPSSGINANTDYSYMTYCCRQDGDADHPILLPSQDPFYLYRIGGKCQEVLGMDVSNEWIYLDSGDDKYDAYGYTNHPDGFINRNVRIELCYYTPKA